MIITAFTTARFWSTSWSTWTQYNISPTYFSVTCHKIIPRSRPSLQARMHAHPRKDTHTHTQTHTHWVWHEIVRTNYIILFFKDRESSTWTLSNPCTGLDMTWRSQEIQVTRFQDNQHMKVVRLSALCAGRLSPPPHPARKYSWYSFLLEAESSNSGPKCGRKDLYVKALFLHSREETSCWHCTRHTQKTFIATV